jgi:allantoinase
MNTKVRVLSNVFLNITANKLKLCDIFFDKKIVNIIPKTQVAVSWEEISTKEKLKSFIDKINIKKLAPSPSVIDGEFLLAIPGGIDSHVHFGTPGFEDHEDFQHGSTAAAFGGTTTVFDMPCTSVPPVTNVNNFNLKLSEVQSKSIVDFALWGGIRGNDFVNNIAIQRQIIPLAKEGIAGFKMYFNSSMDTFTELTKMQFQVVIDMVSQLKKTLAIHCEDKESIDSKMKLIMSQERDDWRAYAQAKDERVESEAVRTSIAASKRTKCRVLIAHISSELALNMVRDAKKEGIPVHAETCPHYLYFSQKDFANQSISNFLKTDPIVKKESDREALWEGVKDGTISFISSDHAGCDPEKHKSSNDFWRVYSGIPGVEHRIPFLFSEGFIKRNLTIEGTIRLLSTNQAQFFNIKNKGKIEVGYDADIALVNLWDEKSVSAKKMHSKGKYTPFEGVVFKAFVEKTIVRGKVVSSWKAEPEVTFGHGKFITIL